MSDVYEAASLAMRYWFFIVGAIVLLGVTSISIKEYRDKRYVLGVAKSSIGYLAVVSGPEDIRGVKMQLMLQNTIGRSRRADIVLSDRSVEKAHAQLYLAEDDAVYLSRLGSGEITVNGARVNEYARLKDTDIVCFGNVVVRVHIKEVE
jgi:Uncharacterized conserved protein, contains FHA domain